MLTKGDIGKLFTPDGGGTVYRLMAFETTPRVVFRDMQTGDPTVIQDVNALEVRAMKRLVVEEK